MNCEAALDLIHARLDGELGVEDAIRLGEHFSACAQCREIAHDLEQINTLVSKCPVHPDEGKIAVNALQALERATPKPREPQRKWLWLTAACSSAAAAVLLIVNFSRDTVEVSSVPAPNEKIAQPVKTPEAANPFNGQELADDVLKRQFLSRHQTEQSRTMEERARLRKLADLARNLRTPGRAGTAAEELLSFPDGNETQRMFQVAAAVADPQVGNEIFETLSASKPGMRLVPVYIAALDVTKFKIKARDLLCAVSGKKFGPNRDEWLAWWMSARTASSKMPG